MDAITKALIDKVVEEISTLSSSAVWLIIIILVMVLLCGAPVFTTAFWLLKRKAPGRVEVISSLFTWVIGASFFVIGFHLQRNGTAIDSLNSVQLKTFVVTSGFFGLLASLPFFVILGGIFLAVDWKRSRRRDQLSDAVRKASGELTTARDAHVRTIGEIQDTNDKQKTRNSWETYARANTDWECAREKLENLKNSLGG